ncbi:pathogenesis-related leaf protein 4-like protein [Tanacetum coccineum]
MSSFKLSFSLTCLVVLTILHTNDALTEQEEFLTTHNSVRSQEGVGNVVWNATVAAYAQTYANQRKVDCNLVLSGGPYGENLGKSTSGTFTATAAVNQWAAEKAYYTYSTNTCASGHLSYSRKYLLANVNEELPCLETNANKNSAIATGPVSYATLLNDNASRKSVNFRTLLAPAGNGADVAISKE